MSVYFSIERYFVVNVQMFDKSRSPPLVQIVRRRTADQQLKSPLFSLYKDFPACRGFLSFQGYGAGVSRGSIHQQRILIHKSEVWVKSGVTFHILSSLFFSSNSLQMGQSCHETFFRQHDLLTKGPHKNVAMFNKLFSCISHLENRKKNIEFFPEMDKLEAKTVLY